MRNQTLAFNFITLGSIMLLCSWTSLSHAVGPQHGKTMKAVKERGYLKCGVSQGLAGFSNPNSKGDWQGLDVDFCRAVAAAVLKDANKVKFTPLSSKERFTALQSGEIDLLSRNTTWTFSRDTSLGLDFSGTLYYDGQGFLVRKKDGVKTVKDLNGASICSDSGTTTELNVADYFKSHNLKYKIITFEKADETFAAYESKRCDVYTTDASGLAAQRLKLKDPAEHMVLDEIISKEPLGPVVRQGDDQWGNIVRWTLFAIINAEELGVNKANVQKMKKSKKPEVARLLGTQGNLGELLSLNPDWAFQVVSQVGNYEDIFERNLGLNSPLSIARGQNALWTKGGILYAPPMR